jgi:hypothetical protein
MTRRKRKYSVRGKEAPSQSSRDMPEEAKLHEVIERANGSERHGMKFGLFPSWVEDYKLSNKELALLITMAQEIP